MKLWRHMYRYVLTRCSDQLSLRCLMPAPLRPRHRSLRELLTICGALLSPRSALSPSGTIPTCKQCTRISPAPFPPTSSTSSTPAIAVVGAEKGQHAVLLHSLPRRRASENSACSRSAAACAADQLWHAARCSSPICCCYDALPTVPTVRCVLLGITHKLRWLPALLIAQA